MTAEIAVMNASGVALAADSAVTVQGQKVMNSANKLFMLSKYEPVAVMVYGHASLYGVPWETIIKRYRLSLGTGQCQSVEEYAAQFVEYLRDGIAANPAEFPAMPDEARRGMYFAGLHSLMEALVSCLGAGPDAQPVMEMQIAAMRAQWSEAESLDEPSLERSRAAFVDLRGDIEELIAGYLPEGWLSQEAHGNLMSLIAELYNREAFVPGSESGFVIAGFGEAEMFPAVVAYEADVYATAFHGALRVRPGSRGAIGHLQHASIMAFAQQEMVETFMRGMHPGYFGYLAGHLEQVLTNDLPATVADVLRTNGIDEQPARQLSEIMTAVGTKYLQEALLPALDGFGQGQFVNPTLEVVSSLTKEELAEMAESLVSLTSFRRKISFDAQSVGGPVDVAVVSKGDGFVWVKRKHYFKPDLNQHFFSNYYREGAGA